MLLEALCKLMQLAGPTNKLVLFTAFFGQNLDIVICIVDPTGRMPEGVTETIICASEFICVGVADKEQPSAP